MINQERKKFALTQARKPSDTGAARTLARTALVHAPNETGYCYIAFSEEFLAFVAKELPRGLAPFDPAFIRVSHLGDLWQVEAVYVQDGTSEILWRTPEIPKWVGKLRKEKVDGSDTAATND